MLIVATVFIASSCMNTSNKSENKAYSQKDLTEIYYTCNMHPEVHSDKPGNCPKCGMELVEAKSSEADSIQLDQYPDSMHHNK
jgi:transcription initiation factor IIE alpha subunit